MIQNSTRDVSFKERVYTVVTAQHAEWIWSNIAICPHGDTCLTCCWEWQKGRLPSGYGHFSVMRQGAKVHLYVHRLIGLFVYGEIPNGICVLHRCDNPPCCNPAHLWLGTQKDNVDDRGRKGRTATGERSGARLHPESRARGEHHGSRTHPERFRLGNIIPTEKHARGERHGQAKLTDIQVQMIRSLHGSTRQKALAQQFGVDKNTIRAIHRGRTWRHLLEQNRRTTEGSAEESQA